MSQTDHERGLEQALTLRNGHSERCANPGDWNHGLKYR